ncbi:MAG: hypothetical protein J0M33_10795 [Anaerolineae bacterium]|nr:hypothetical protein [Anaerolineae bacterium]
MKRLFWLTLAAVLLAACQPAGPQRTFTKGDEVAYYDFDQPGTFEEGSYNEGQARLEITEGRYLITVLDGDGETWYGQWGAPVRDVVVDVEAQQLTDSPATVYGVGCRMRGSVGVNLATDPALDALAEANASSSGEIVALAEVTPEATEAVEAEVTAEATAEVTREAVTDAAAEATPEATLEVGGSNEININNGDGYLFVVSGDGRFAILRSRGRNVTALVDWTANAVIRPGAGNNNLRAVCVGDYLALYVNGTFVGDVIDDIYTDGQVGLVAAASGRAGQQVSFDNLSVSVGTPGTTTASS